MQCYNEVIAPSAVTHSVAAPFVSGGSLNLIVVRLSLLQVFELVKTSSPVSHHGPDRLDAHSRSIDGSSLDGVDHNSQLVFHSEYALAGTVVDIAAVRLPGAKFGRKALVIAFKDAKMSLVTWDPDAHSIATVSIHFYEGDGVSQNPALPTVGQTSAFLTADPHDRCVALKFGARHVAILPLKQSGDDIMETDYDHDFDALVERPTGEQTECPYLPSFVLPLTILDPGLNLPIHFSFLHGYREPTFGILFAKKHPSSALLLERRDPLCYAVYSFDIEKRTSTSLVSVSGLPYDLCEVVPLRLPAGGVLLVGANEIVHVDQSGKVLAVAVNEFARQSSALNMADSSALGLRLEGCIVQPLGTDSSDLLIVLSDGRLAIVGFQLDGRSVSQLRIEIVEKSHVADPFKTAMSCSALVSADTVFLGSLDGDSRLVRWTSRARETPRERTHQDLLDDIEGGEVDLDDIDDDDDDLYASRQKPKDSRQPVAGKALDVQDVFFSTDDVLPALATVRDFALRPKQRLAGSDGRDDGKVLIYAAAGMSQDSSVAVLSRSVRPVTDTKVECGPASRIWSAPAARESAGESKGGSRHQNHDLLYFSYPTADRPDKTIEVRSLQSKTMPSHPLGDLDPESGPTVEIGTIFKGRLTVQVLESEVKSFDHNCDLAQILPIEDEDGNELKVKAASICDPYVMLIRDDASVQLLEADAAGELDELILGKTVRESRWVSGCVASSSLTANSPAAFLLRQDGGLVVLDLAHPLEPIYTTDCLSDLPTVLGTDASGCGSVRDSICEILVADIGAGPAVATYLVVRNVKDDLFVYRPFSISEGSGQTSTIGPNTRWRKVKSFFATGQDDPSEPSGSVGSPKLRSLSAVGLYDVVVLTGSHPGLLIQEASSPLRLLPLDLPPVRDVCSINSPTFPRRFGYLDRSGNLSVGHLPEGRFGDTGWHTWRVPMGLETKNIRYHAPGRGIVVGSSYAEDFKLPADEYHPEWEEETTGFLPQVEQSVIRLFDADKMTEIDRWILESHEIITCVEVVDMVVSEVTLERKPVIVVGTAIQMGEDLAQNGHIYIFDLIEAVPVPTQPESTRRLKMMLREQVKGAVTAVTEIGTQGLVLVIHGQKCMVRGLKEDGTFLPTAFMDLQCYVPSAKTIAGTGLVAMADAMKGLWLVGYTEDPYKMILFGKSQPTVEVVLTEFFPYLDQLFMLAVDADGMLHMFEFAPEDPKSVSGQRLLERSSFFLGTSPTRLVRLSVGSGPEVASRHQILCSTEFGGFAILSAIPSEDCYRVLHAMQNHLTGHLDHHCGLNPRAYRQIETDGFGSRGILDGSVLARWYDLSASKRAESSGRIGAREDDLRADMSRVVGSVAECGIF